MKRRWCYGLSRIGDREVNSDLFFHTILYLSCHSRVAERRRRPEASLPASETNCPRRPRRPAARGHAHGLQVAKPRPSPQAFVQRKRHDEMRPEAEERGQRAAPEAEQAVLL